MICCICGKKLSVMDYSYPLSNNLYKYKICVNCNEHTKKLEVNQTKEGNDIARKYLIKYMQNPEMEQVVRNALEEMLVCANKNVLESQDKRNYNKVLKEIESSNNNVSKTDYASSSDSLCFIKENNLLTSGYNFEGYKIISYKGIVSGEVALGTGFLSELSASFNDFFGTESDEFANKLKSAKNAAQIKMIDEAAKIGGNAIIGVDFEFTTFSNNIIGVSANGTAVEVEKV